MEGDIGRFLNSLDAERQFSPNTIAAYRNDLRQFMTFLQEDENEHLADVGRPANGSDLAAEHIDGYLADMQERGYASSTLASSTSCAV